MAAKAAVSPAAVPTAPTGGVTTDDAHKPPSARGGWGQELALVAARGSLDAVLAELDEHHTRAHGPLVLAPSGDPVVHASAPADAVPRELLGFRSQPLELVTTAGERCPVAVAGFRYRADLLPDMDELASWDGLGDQPAPRPLSGDELASAIWKSTYTRMLTAELRPRPGPRCEGEPLFVRKTGSRAGVMATAVHGAPQVKRAALAAFRGLPSYQELQRAYLHGGPDHLGAMVEDPALWESYERAPVVQAFELPGTSGTLVSVSVPLAGCSPYDPSLWAAFHVASPKAEPTVLFESREHAPHSVVGVRRAPDGVLEFIVRDNIGDGLAVVRDDQVVAAWRSEFHGCAC